MAYTISRRSHNFGDLRVQILSCTADAATQNIETGLSVIYGHTVGMVSMAAVAQFYAGAGATGTSIASMVGASGLTSGDEFYLVVYGK